MALLPKNNKYNWNFENIGGSSRVRITSGQDIAHLAELDPKLWTVLSCPIKGLEINEKSLSYIDIDGDEKIRVNDIVAVSKWITGALKNPDSLLQESDHIALCELNQDNSVGNKIYKAAKQILENLGKDTETISLTDTQDIVAIFAQTRFNGDGVITEATPEDADEKAVVADIVKTLGGVNDRSGVLGANTELIENFYKALEAYVAWKQAEVPAPFGADTDKAIATYQALDAKVKDFFLRSQLAGYSPASTATLDVQNARIEAISGDNLTAKTDEIATYPLVRITGQPEIDLNAPVNPAWASQFNFLKAIAFPKDATVLTESDWSAIGAQFAAYLGWKNSKAGAAVEALGLETIEKHLQQNKKAALLCLVEQDLALKEEAENIELVDRFLHIHKDFYRLLRNFITFHDFYDKDKKVQAIFQSGTLIVDQRACRFCMQVADTGKHSGMAAASGMYLIYCDCTRKNFAGKLQIVAAMTVGNIGDISVGKNAIYYDNDGQEWDAVITKIIDNPISLGQAFWSPYRRLATLIENLINKNASDKDAKIMKEMNDKINAAPAALPASKDADGAAAAAPPFDIAKFAGIFAAIGMAFGMIASAVASLVKGFVSLTWWQVIIVFVGLLLAISGPAMVMAWLKLRRRNLAPLLNANGWAINAASKISIPFGETLTDQAHFPKLKLKDPYKKKGLAPWKKWTISGASLLIVLAILWLCNLFAWAQLPSPLPWFAKEEVAEECILEETTLESAEEACCTGETTGTL
jgi:hypothetical protein